MCYIPIVCTLSLINKSRFVHTSTQGTTPQCIKKSTFLAVIQAQGLDPIFNLKLCTNMHSVVVCSLLLISVACGNNCTTWLHPSGDGQCLCGPSLGTVVVCNNETQEVGVLRSYCITSSEDENNTSVVGRCLVVLHHGERLLSPVGLYDKVLPNVNDQDQQTCGYLNRQGQLCGKCKYNQQFSAQATENRSTLIPQQTAYSYETSK